MLAIVTAFLGGMAAGAWILDRRIRRPPSQPNRVCSARQIVIHESGPRLETAQQVNPSFHSSGGGFGGRRVCLRLDGRLNRSPYRCTMAAAGSRRTPTPPRSWIKG